MGHAKNISAIYRNILRIMCMSELHCMLQQHAMHNVSFALGTWKRVVSKRAGRSRFGFEICFCNFVLFFK